LSRLWGVIAAAAAGASVVFCAAIGPAQAAEPASGSLLLFGGTDLWRDSGFIYGGLLWSPAGLNAEGFTLKVLLDGGGYDYASGTLHAEVGGTLLSAAAMPGWRFTGDGMIVTLFAGAAAQDYRLTPYDPGSRLHGFYLGAQFAADVWYQPSAATMVAFNGAGLSIGPTEWMRAAFGFRLLEPFFVGPEALAIWCADYEEFRLGAHVTGWRFGALEWGAGAGWAADSDRRAGPYLRLGINAKY